MKPSNILLIFVLSLPFCVFSQVDYMEYRDYYNLSCGSPDSAEIVHNQQLVDSLATMQILHGEKEYLYDHAWVYYMRYLKWKDINDLKISATSFEKGWEKYQDIYALWNLSGLYRQLGNCKKSLDLTELYLQEVPDSIAVDYQQIYYRYKFCRNKE